MWFVQHVHPGYGTACNCLMHARWLQVMYTTAFSTMLSFTGAVASGQLVPSLYFVIRNPDAMYYILALSVSSAVVQLIISYTIKRYGAVVFATIMTTRQFFSILLSSLVFWTPLQHTQWWVQGLECSLKLICALCCHDVTCTGVRCCKFACVHASNA